VDLNEQQQLCDDVGWSRLPIERVRLALENSDHTRAVQASAQDGLDLIAQEWAAVNEDLGLEDQLALYQESIGYMP